MLAIRFDKRNWLNIRAFILMIVITVSANPVAIPAKTTDILIGQVAPYSGPLAPTGIDYARGIEMGFEAINRQGGIKGRRLRLIKADDGYKVEQTVNKANELLVQHSDLIAFAGFVGTGNLEALIKNKILYAQRIPLIGIRTGAVRELDPYIFHLRASYNSEVSNMVRHASTIGLDTLAVFYQDDAFGKAGLKAAEEFAKQYNVKILAKEAYQKNTTKVIPAAEALAKVDAKVILMVSNTAASAEFVKEYRKRNGVANLMIISVTDGEQLYQKVGKDLARGIVIAQVIPNPYNRISKIAREFQDVVANTKLEGAKANYTEMEGYITARLLGYALEKAPQISREALITTLENMGRINLGDFSVDFTSKKHEGSSYVDLSVVTFNGKLLQ